VNDLLAYAESWDSTQSNIVLVVSCGFGLASVGGLVGLIFVLTRRNAHPYATQLTTAALFWGLFCVGTFFYVAEVQLNWVKEHVLDVQSGYGDPQAAGPPLPWILWGALAAIYLLLLSGTVWKKESF
jgi:hypothetical protein